MGHKFFFTIFFMNRKCIHKNSLLLRIRHSPLLYESTLGMRKINVRTVRTDTELCFRKAASPSF